MSVVDPHVAGDSLHMEFGLVVHPLLLRWNSRKPDKTSCRCWVASQTTVVDMDGRKSELVLFLLRLYWAGLLGLFLLDIRLVEGGKPL